MNSKTAPPMKINIAIIVARKVLANPGSKARVIS